MKSLTLPKITILLILIINSIVASNVNWHKDHWKGILGADAKGYYAYLPATFIYNDLNFGFFNSIEKEKYYSPNLYYDYRAYHNNKTINKYYCGTAVAQLPFFIIAHTLAKTFELDADGYSKIYLICINLAAIFYLASGLLYFNSILKFFFYK